MSIYILLYHDHDPCESFTRNQVPEISAKFWKPRFYFIRKYSTNCLFIYISQWRMAKGL